MASWLSVSCLNEMLIPLALHYGVTDIHSLSTFKLHRGSTAEMLACSSTDMAHSLTQRSPQKVLQFVVTAISHPLKELVFPCPFSLFLRSFSLFPHFSGVTRVWVHGSFMLIISGRAAAVRNIFLTQNIFPLFIMQLQLSPCYNEHFLLLFQALLSAKYSF